jgi:GT2 family glycosyltransferase
MHVSQNKFTPKRPDSKPEIYFVVLNWNQSAQTMRCIRSVLRSKGVPYHIVAIDNGSTDGSANDLKKVLHARNKRISLKSQRHYFKYPFRGESVAGWFERIGKTTLMSCEKNYGFTGGCNAGIHYGLLSGATHVVLLNNDAIIRPETIEILSSVSYRNNAAIVGAQILDAVAVGNNKTVFENDGKVIYNRRIWPFSFFQAAGLFYYLFKLSRFLPLSKPVPECWRSDFVGGCCMLIRTDLLQSRLERDGYYLDPAFFMYWEETDLCLYGRKNGFITLYSRDAVAEHYPLHRLERGVNPRLCYYFSRNSLFCTCRWLPKPLYLIFVAYYFFSLILLHFFRFIKKGMGAFDIAKIEFSGFFDGLQNNSGKWNKHDAP